MKFTVGKLADSCGVSVTTVRYYQKRGLLGTPARSGLGGVRCYGEADVMRLRGIRRAQELGFTLAEITRLFRSLDDSDWSAVKELACDRMNAVNAQVQKLKKISAMLSNHVDNCSSSCSIHCSLIADLLGKDGSGPKG